jgi:hypothetical protein
MGREKEAKMEFEQTSKRNEESRQGLLQLKTTKKDWTAPKPKLRKS